MNDQHSTSAEGQSLVKLNPTVLYLKKRIIEQDLMRFTLGNL